MNRSFGHEKYQWGRWHFGWINEWADGDWRVTLHWTSIFPHVGSIHSDDGELNFVCFSWMCLGFTLSRYLEPIVPASNRKATT